MRLTIPLLLISIATASALEFEPGRAITSYIGKPEEIVPADLDDDGDLDLVLRTGISRAVLLFENKGAGKLEQAAVWEADGGRIRGIADFDSDGVPDLLVTSAPSAEEQSELKILYGTGLDGYGPRQTVLGSFIHYEIRVEVADVDVSGKPDVILLDRVFIDPGRDQPLEVVMGNVGFVDNVAPTRWADVNGDGLPDALISRQQNIHVDLNLGGGKFGGITEMHWEIQNVIVQDIQFVRDERLPNGQGFIVLLTDTVGEAQRVSLVVAGEGEGEAMRELASLPIGAGATEREGTWLEGFSSAPDKPLLAAVLDWTTLPISPDYLFSSLRGSVVEISHTFRRNKPVLVKITRLSFQGGAGPLVYADLNGDEIDDLVSSGWRDGDSASGQLRYYPGKRNGTFAAKAVVLTGPATDDIATHVSDFDGDGDQDLIGRGYSLEDHTTEVVVWENLGAGNLRRRALFSGLYNAEIVSIADRNGDSRPDLLVSGIAWKTKKDEGERSLLLSLSGKGSKRKSLTLYREAGNGAFDQVRAGDWDGDGTEDLLVWTGTTAYEAMPASWLKGLPGNRFAAPQPLGEGFGEVLQDMDGDGDLDLVPSRRQLYVGAQDGWRENTGPGNLPVFHEFPEIAGAEDIRDLISAEADLNGDGRIDLIGFRETIDSTFFRPVIVGAGVTFTALPEFPSGEPWFHDMDGDGDRDLLLATSGPTFSYRGIALLENTGGAIFAAPTGIDEVNLGHWSPILAGDLDGDGKADVIASSLDPRSRIEWFKAE